MEIKKYTVGQLKTNSYLIISDGVGAIIDPGNEEKMLCEEIEKSGAELKYILLTHGHVDHIGACSYLSERFGAKIVCGENEKELLLDPKLNLSGSFGDEFFVSPHILLKEGDEIEIGSVSLKVLNTPGHTGGSIVYLGDGIMFSGDTLFKGCVGRTDLPTGDSNQLFDSLSKLKSLMGDYKIFPGHYDNTTLSYEIKFNPYLK